MSVFTMTPAEILSASYIELRARLLEPSVHGDELEMICAELARRADVVRVAYETADHYRAKWEQEDRT